jgi:branched-chain amino acid transport system permease protein
MIDVLWSVFVGPFRDMASAPTFLAEVLIGGVAAGLMYSLVALGFVLIFKASGVFNFAQGVMVLFAALTLVGLLEHGVPVPVALALTTLVMIALAFGIERVVLRPLVNQPHIILFMATIGLNFFLEGFGEMLWGAKSGVQFSLSLIALKALPVLILGGFESVPGAIVGGLIIGVGEKVGEVYWGPLVGGAIENWFAYVLALAFLLFRPQGLFGEKIIERV